MIGWIYACIGALVAGWAAHQIRQQDASDYAIAIVITGALWPIALMFVFGEWLARRWRESKSAAGREGGK